MSWEESDPVFHTCPCGKGNYAVIQRSDDWGRFDERWEMHCSQCSARYGLYAYQTIHKALIGTDYRWVRKEVLRKLHSLCRRIDAEQGKVSRMLKKKYERAWREVFIGKTKKAIWSELTESGKSYPSLPTFYDHVRHAGLQGVVGRYLSYPHATTVVRVLHLKDSQLASLIQGIQELEQQAESDKQKIRAEAFA